MTIKKQNNSPCQADLKLLLVDTGYYFAKILCNFLLTEVHKMSKYITESERYKIETMLEDNVNVKEIANRLGKHYTTIYREIKRGTVTLKDTLLQDYKKYCADVAQRKQENNSHNKGIELKIGNDLKTVKHIEHLVKDLHYSAYAVALIYKKIILKHIYVHKLYTTI